MTQRAWTIALSLLAALAAALLPLLVAQGVLNAIAGQDIGVAVGVIVGAFHGGAAVAGQSAKAANGPVTTTAPATPYGATIIDPYPVAPVK